MVSDSITLDTVAPTVPTPTGVATNGGAQVSWTAATDSGSNITRYTLVYSKDAAVPADCDSGTQAYQGSGLSVNLEGLDNDSTYRFRLCALDGAGNTGVGGKVNVTPSAEAGSPGTISIESGASWTNSASVSLSRGHRRPHRDVCVELVELHHLALGCGHPQLDPALR